MTALRLLAIAIRSIYRALRPTWFAVLRVNRKVAKESKKQASIPNLVGRVEMQLRFLDHERRQSSASATQTIYSLSLQRVASLETKAIGLVQVQAVIAAAIGIAWSGATSVPTWVRMTGLASLGYLAFALMGAMAGFRVLPRYYAPSSDAFGPTSATAEMAAATERNIGVTQQTANIVTGATADTARAVIVALVSLGAHVWLA